MIMMMARIYILLLCEYKGFRGIRRFTTYVMQLCDLMYYHDGSSRLVIAYAVYLVRSSSILVVDAFVEWCPAAKNSSPSS
jgi:hypothetical protein